MPSFSYRALGRDGKEVRGVLQAESETAAVTRIRDNYPVLLSISEQADKKMRPVSCKWRLEISRSRQRRCPSFVPSLPLHSDPVCP